MLKNYFNLYGELYGLNYMVYEDLDTFHIEKDLKSIIQNSQ